MFKNVTRKSFVCLFAGVVVSFFVCIFISQSFALTIQNYVDIDFRALIAVTASEVYTIQVQQHHHNYLIYKKLV